MALSFSCNQKVYLYDGSFEGLLSIVFDCYVQKQIPSHIIEEKQYIPNLLDTVETYHTDYTKAERIFHGILKSISYQTLYENYYAFLANVPEKEMSILLYLLNGFSIGPKINTMLSLDFVFQVHSLRKKMLSEAHKLKGLLRFKEVGDNLFYACIHPTHNVIENVGQHFVRRLPHQNFIIHDATDRGLLFLYDTHQYQIQSDKDFIVPSISEREKEYQQLWKTFFQTIAIEERKNQLLQMQFMPKKYWKDLVELS